MIRGRIEFVDDPSGGIGLRQRWNPDSLSKEDRGIVAEQLRDIAAAMEDDRFECCGVYEHFPPEE
jgi:hypothetical protein